MVEVIMKNQNYLCYRIIFLVFTVTISACTSNYRNEIFTPVDEIKVRSDQKDENYVNFNTENNQKIENDVDLAYLYEEAIRPLINEENLYFSVRFFPERLHNPNNIFPFHVVPVEILRAMYWELNYRFDYFALIPTSFGFMGFYEGCEKFIDFPDHLDSKDFINRPYIHDDGSRGYISLLRGVFLGRTLYQDFDNNISQGRNLTESDFYKNSPYQMISVVLGNAYKDSYNIGDVLQLEMYWSLVDFEIVGFFESGVGIFSEFGTMIFDYSIIAPLFSIGYEPSDDDNQLFQAFHYTQATSGMIRIDKPIYEISLHTKEKYRNFLSEMADRHGLTNTFHLNPLPVPFRKIFLPKP